MQTRLTNVATFRRSFSQILWFLGAAVAILFVALKAPGPLVDRMLKADLLHDVESYSTRIVAHLENGADTFGLGRVTPEDIEFLSRIPTISGIHMVNLYDLSGRVIYSTQPDLIGTIHEDAQEEATSGPGSASYTINQVTDEDPAHRALPATSHEEGMVHYVADVTIPVSSGGVVVGVIALYSEITYLHQVFVFRVQVIMGVIAALALAVMGALLILNQRGNRRQMLAMQDRAGHERSMLQDQLQLAREVRLLGELNEWLQSSRSLGELFEMVARFMTHMLPTCEGSVYVYSNSRDVLDGCSSWNGATHKAHIHPDECWGLRRGRTYVFGDSEIDFTCAHSEPHDGRPYICFPILAHGETVGLMHLRARTDTDKAAFMASRKLAQMSAEQISMAIANVRMRDQLQDQSIRDPLTGLYNRRHLTESLRRSLNARQRSGAPLAVVAIDIDHFKRFNDNHGHDAGDMVLRAVASALGQLCDRDELACRIGGEELMVMLPATTVPEAMARAEAMRAAVEAVTVRYGEKTLPRVTISLGVAVAPDHGALPQDLMLVADNALYKAKAAGRNQVMLAELRSAEPAVPQVGLAPPAAMPDAQPDAQPDHPTAIAAA